MKIGDTYINKEGYIVKVIGIEEIKPTDLIGFGKYKNSTYNEVAKININYLFWLRENTKDIRVKTLLKRLK